MEPPARARLREHPLLRRLPFLLLAALGLWLWQRGEDDQRELVLQLDGPGWEQVRTLDVQVVGREGQVLKREERFFSSAPPPPELTLEARLPEGTYRLLVFAGTGEGTARAPLVETLTVGGERYTVQRLRLPLQQR